MPQLTAPPHAPTDFLCVSRTTHNINAYEYRYQSVFTKTYHSVGKVIWKPTRCKNNSFIDLQDQLNMFRANFCPKHVLLILEINKTVIVASRWFPYYLTYIDDARSNTNQISFTI